MAGALEYTHLSFTDVIYTWIRPIKTSDIKQVNIGLRMKVIHL